MTFQQTIVALLIAIVLAFQAGAYIERGNHLHSDIPSNFDVASCLAGEKSAKAESVAYLTLLQRQTDALGACAKREEAH